MAELNFGLLNPPGSENIANAFVRGQDQAQASQMQNLQMQQATRKGQMDELTYKKALDTESRLNKYYANIAANGGPKTAIEAETAMINSGIPHIADMGAKAQLLRLQNERDLALYTAAKTGPTAAPAVAPMAPAVVPEPGSFGADVAERKAADPFALAPDTPTNMMLGAAAPATATVNNLSAIATGVGGRTIDDMKAERDRMLRVPGKAAERQIAILNADIALASKESPDIATMRALGYPNTQAGYAAFRATQRQPRLLTPDEEDQRTRIALASRPPAQPQAPSITSIVDPTNPNQMITIDARRYAGGGANAPGVIGVAGKEPSAALRENKQEAGKSLLADEISNLRAALNTLNAARAIPSTERGALSNISSSLASSGVGQIAGRIVGTEAQTERDVISSSKLRLVNAIKQATGMSAQQLNSNVELQTMLKSLSDPSQSIEANIRNLDNIEKSYVNATSAATPTPTPTPKAAPAIGTIQGGYRFNGGDPSKINSWTKVGG